MLKHRLKRLLRRIVARACHHLGLRGLFRPARAGIPLLMFHNVGDDPGTAYLPGHMKISEARLERLLRLLSRSGQRTRTLDQIADDLGQDSLPCDVVGLTFDDGYRDNHDRLLPLLQKHGATATVFVQTGPTKGRLNWLHHYFWVLHRVGPHRLGELLAEHVERPSLRQDLRSLPPDEVAAEYEMKRLLKYEVTPADRDRILAEIFAEQGGDDAELARTVYMGPEECRALDQAGVEIGAHTVNHLVLSSLPPNKQRQEIEGSLRDLESWLGHPVPSFAYPYGRTWDYDDNTRAILQELGFRTAVTAMPGLNDAATPRLELRRIPVNDEADLAEVLCEVDGVFDWFARAGLNLRG